MTYFPLTPEQHAWRERVAALAAREIGPRAAEADRAARFPKASLEALRREGLWGLRVAQAHGGLGADALTTCLVVEEIAKHCPSTAMCYKMHLEACELHQSHAHGVSGRPPGDTPGARGGVRHRRRGRECRRRQ